MRCGRCCTSFGVCVTPFDILRISKRVGLAPSSFIFSIEEPPAREREEPAVLINGVRSLIILRWTSQRRCVFYGEGGCTVYASRPMLCRTYPFRLVEGRLADMKSRACPEPWVPRAKSAYLSSLRRYSAELDRYKNIAERWNHGPGGDLESFLSFALQAAKEGL